jgi:hypothetical protein
MGPICEFHCPLSAPVYLLTCTYDSRREKQRFDGPAILDVKWFVLYPLHDDWELTSRTKVPREVEQQDDPCNSERRGTGRAA